MTASHDGAAADLSRPRFAARLHVSLRGRDFDRDGSKFGHAHCWGEARDGPAALGARVAAELPRQGARGIIEGVPQ